MAASITPAGPGNPSVLVKVPLPQGAPQGAPPAAQATAPAPAAPLPPQKVIVFPH